MRLIKAPVRKKKKQKKRTGVIHAQYETITRCRRCGTCCSNGGPTLHYQDKRIIDEGRIGYEHLVTIRRGELAFTPLTGALEPVPREIVKISGKGRTWSCYFYDETEFSCTIYDYRPFECRLLKCWDTSELLSALGKETMSRFDIVDPNEPVVRLIDKHERECPYEKAERLLNRLSHDKNAADIIAELTELARKDLATRSQAQSDFGLSLPLELFLFGRPLFKLLRARGLSVYEAEDDIQIEWEPF